jgi:beta-N-acetylhexosaminidase
MVSATDARVQGIATGHYLRRLGINADLAPVLDLPKSSSAFIASRSFASSPTLVASRGVSFARGVLAAGTVATAKHFPGLGRLTESTDYGPETISASRAALTRDLVPFRKAIRDGVPAIMVGTATYPAYGDGLPAACSPSVVMHLLRGTLHFRGVILSDDLDTAGVWGQIPPPQAAFQAVKVGIDIVYIAGVNGSGGDSIGEEAFTALMRAAKDGRLSRTALTASFQRIRALKSRYASG